MKKSKSRKYGNNVILFIIQFVIATTFVVCNIVSTTTSSFLFHYDISLVI